MQSKLIEQLLEEHRVIERLLASLLRVTARAVVGDSVTKGVIAEHVKLFRELLDALHHGREEDILFASLVAMGLPRQQGPVAVMLHEHRVGRELVSRLSAVAEGRGTLTVEQQRELTQAASAFVELLSSHIAKEDGVLYPMALGRLDATTLAEIDAEAANWDRAASCDRERLMQSAGQLCQSTLDMDSAWRERRIAAG